jgi:uncharacterized protein
MIKANFGVLVIAVAVIVSSVFLGRSYSSKNKMNDTISVTGLGEESFTSDLIVWKANFSNRNYDLKQASTNLKNDRAKITSYLVSKGINKEDIVFSAVDIQKEFSNVYDQYGNYQSSSFSGYLLSQSLRIESKEVDKIENISREVTELINQGIELSSNSPDYYYTKLAELKLKMIENATKDATERA